MSRIDVIINIKNGVEKLQAKIGSTLVGFSHTFLNLNANLSDFQD